MTLWKSNLAFCALLALGILGLNGIAIVKATAETPENYDFSEFDENNDGYLDHSEYVAYSYELIDYSNDGLIDENEWNDYRSVWYSGSRLDNTQDFSSYDVNGDGVFDQSEYLGAYDSDLYNLWDYDNDGFVGTSEYGKVATLYDNADIDGLYEW